MSKIWVPTATFERTLDFRLERKNDNSHNSIIHYITHTTGACAVDAVTSWQIGLGKQKIEDILDKSYKMFKIHDVQGHRSPKIDSFKNEVVPNIQTLLWKFGVTSWELKKRFKTVHTV